MMTKPANVVPWKAIDWARAVARRPVMRALAAILIASWACLGGLRTLAAAHTPPGSDGLAVVVTVPALKGLVEPLLPAGSSVTMLIQPGRSEHGYEFTSGDIAKLGQSDLVVYIGLGLEPRVEEFLKENPAQGRVVVEMARAVKIEAEGEQPARDTEAKDAAGKVAAPAHGEPGHVHGEHCDHGPIDVHLWLDPVLVEQFVPELQKAIGASLARRHGFKQVEQDALAEAATQLRARIAALDAEHRDRLAPFKGAAIVTHHAAFGRLADRYGLKIAEVLRPVETAEPSPGQVAGAVKAIREQKARAVFFEPQFNPAAAQRIARAAKVQLGRLDPLGDGDWFAMMRANLNELVEKLER